MSLLENNMTTKSISETGNPQTVSLPPVIRAELAIIEQEMSNYLLCSGTIGRIWVASGIFQTWRNQLRTILAISARS